MSFFRWYTLVMGGLYSVIARHGSGGKEKKV